MTGLTPLKSPKRARIGLYSVGLQTYAGKLKPISGQGKATTGAIMQIGNTQTPIKFKDHPDTYMARWFAEAPTHHCALSLEWYRYEVMSRGELLLYIKEHQTGIFAQNGHLDSL